MKTIQEIQSMPPSNAKKRAAISALRNRIKPRGQLVRGGQTRVAAACKVSIVAVHRWLSNDFLPSDSSVDCILTWLANADEIRDFTGKHARVKN
jgi:hypothetical protein